MQVMRVISDAASGKKPHVTARLYENGKLLCAAQKVTHAGEKRVPQDSVVLEKLYGSLDMPGLTGVFRDKNIGYIVEFLKGDIDNSDAQSWRFEVRHKTS